MTNREKYAKEIMDIAIAGHSLALVNGVPMACGYVCCTACDLNTDDTACAPIEPWANSEYKEVHPCANCKVDDKVWVRNIEEEPWRKRHFAKIEDGIVYCYLGGLTSWSSERKNISGFKYAKPYEEGGDT